MKTHQIVGLVLAAVGAGDVILGTFVLPARIADPRARGIVTAVLQGGGLLMACAGAAAFFGLLPF